MAELITYVCYNKENGLVHVQGSERLYDTVSDHAQRVFHVKYYDSSIKTAFAVHEVIEDE